VAACPSCRHENPDDARFCSACGTALETAAETTREQRKVVTVLFCDLVGSTALGESTDPEALRARMRRYFESLRAILERHGGTVEKFVGDAVMAMFGIPTAREDDALRAMRAASEIREAWGSTQKWKSGCVERPRLAETTDFYWLRGTSLLRLAEALALAGRTVEALEEAAGGLAHYEAKGDIASGALARERLVTLGIEVDG
jgi:hypothetical protein